MSEGHVVGTSMVQVSGQKRTGGGSGLGIGMGVGLTGPTATSSQPGTRHLGRKTGGRPREAWGPVQPPDCTTARNLSPSKEMGGALRSEGRPGFVALGGWSCTKGLSHPPSWPHPWQEPGP